MTLLTAHAFEKQGALIRLDESAAQYSRCTNLTQPVTWHQVERMSYIKLRRKFQAFRMKHSESSTRLCAGLSNTTCTICTADPSTTHALCRCAHSPTRALLCEAWASFANTWKEFPIASNILLLVVSSPRKWLANLQAFRNCPLLH